MSEENTTPEASVTSESTPVAPAAPAAPAAATSSGIGLKDLLIPISIVVAGALMGIGLFFSGANFTGGQQQQAQNGNTQQQQQQAADTTDKIDPVTEDDWIKGDINAPIKIVEFSDFECPFCKRFHETLEQVVADNNGEVAWVFRQFPLEQLHQKAVPVAIASECVGKIGGDEAFWTFTDGYFRDTLTNDRTDIETLIPKLVVEAGVSQAAFTTCFQNGETEAAVNADLQDAVETGGRGTPWSVLIAPNGKTYPVNGAQPAAVVQQIINLALEEAS